MNALIFVHRLWTDHEPLLNDDLFRNDVKSSRVKVSRARRPAELRLTAEITPVGATNSEESKALVESVGVKTSG